MTESADPQQKAHSTEAYYERCASTYAEKTLGLQLDELWEWFITLAPHGGYVLDLGCGSGRDLLALSRRGVRVLGLERSAALAAIAREYSGQDVRVGDMRTVEFAAASFDGIWAVASL